MLLFYLILPPWKVIKKGFKGCEILEYINYCLLKNFVVITDNYFLGTLLDKLDTKIFLIDRRNNQLYLTKKNPIGYDYSDLVGFSGKTVISYIYPGKFGDNTKSGLPSEVIQFLENDQYVLCLYELL